MKSYQRVICLLKVVVLFSVIKFTRRMGFDLVSLSHFVDMHARDFQCATVCDTIDCDLPEILYP